MNLNLLPDLALFVQIVDQGSFSAVARQSGITPSAVSRSVSRLEREMGCKLLQRTTRKLRLSDAGETVYQHAQQMLEAARQAMDSARQSPNGRPGKADAQRTESRRPLCDPPADDGVFPPLPAGGRLPAAGRSPSGFYR
jgi:DNA-binding transcriptional LysR family regulator